MLRSIITPLLQFATHRHSRTDVANATYEDKRVLDVPT